MGYTPRARSEGRAIAVAVVVGLIAITVSTVLAGLRGQPGKSWGDESTYIAMVMSLVRDRDLAFTEADRLWAEEQTPPAAVILQRDGESGLAYSKPVLYPVLAAPFAALFGAPGIVVANAFFLLAALYFAWLHLRRLGSASQAAWTLAAFVAGSVVTLYVMWSMTEVLQLALVTAGVSLTLGNKKPATLEPNQPANRRHWLAVALGGVLLGSLISLRLPHLLVAVAPVASLLLMRHFKRAAIVLLAIGAGWGGVASLQLAATGSPDAYRALRSSFDGRTGFPTGIAASEVAERFEKRSATHRTEIPSARDAERRLYSTLYFFIGRHTGLLAYFPAALLFLFYLLRPDRRGAPLCLAALGLCAFYIVWLPGNYFGGSTFVGNRYFFVPFAGLLMALGRLPSKKSIVGVWAVAAVFAASAIASATQYQSLDRSSQSHAHAGAFRLLPYESTAVQMDGQASRYWAGDFVRLADPFARASDIAFTIREGQPSAEVLIASAWPAETMYFLAHSEGREVELNISQGSDTTQVAIQAVAEQSQSLSLVPKAAWRHHGYWWQADSSYATRSLQFSVRSLDGDPSPAKVTVRYLADGVRLTLKPILYVAPRPVPERAVAASTSKIETATRNTGWWIWEVGGQLPVRLGYSLTSLDTGRVVAERFESIAMDVPRMGILHQPIDVQWPTEPGTYELLIDFHREGAGWFSQRTGKPIAKTTVQVTAAGEPES